jgi:hypothetical protein
VPDFGTAMSVAAAPPAGNTDSRPDSSDTLRRQHMDQPRSTAHIGRCSQRRWRLLEPLVHLVPLGSSDSSMPEVVNADPGVDAAAVGDENGYHSRPRSHRHSYGRHAAHSLRLRNHGAVEDSL